MELTIISKGVEYKCLYDAGDHELISEYRWHYKEGYASTNIKKSKPRKKIYMARLIMGVIDNPNIQVDHINHNTLDNRRTNLRLCTSEGNARNKTSFGKTSKYLGVSIKTVDCKYKYIIASINLGYRKGGKTVTLGIFKTQVQAAKAYDIAAKKHFGEFANLNFND